MSVNARQEAEDFATKRDVLSPGDGWPPGQGGRLLASAACSLTALVLSFIGLSHFDLPIIRYVRSVTSSPGDSLAIPWMAFTSHVGDYIGEGTHLVVFSVVLAAMGWLWSNGAITKASIETLVAHTLAAVVVNGLKHLVGRPRPKFTHSGEWVVAPSMVSGFDSFPSGHSAISVAVATVLAKRFPAIGPAVLAIACLVVLSRVLRGSHFPTDVVGGAVIGIVSGVVATAPLQQWRVSVTEGLFHSARVVCGTVAVVWSQARPIDEGIAGTMLMVAGGIAVAGGLWLRRGIEQTIDTQERSTTLSWYLISCGLAALTTSLYVVAAAAATCLAHWIYRRHDGRGKWFHSRWRTMGEGLLLLGILAVGLMLVSVRGVLPFR